MSRKIQIGEHARSDASFSITYQLLHWSVQTNPSRKGFGKSVFVFVLDKDGLMPSGTTINHVKDGVIVMEK
mgnify:CR=1 FL=1